MNFEISLTFSLAQIANMFRDSLDKSLKEIGLHGGQIFILIALWQENGQSQISLAQKLNLSTPTINKMVKSLINNDFVKCEKCGNDGRVVRVYLTDKGLSCRNLVEEQWATLESSFFSYLNETEKLIFLQILEKLKHNLLLKQ